MQHSPGFLKVVDQARSGVTEISVEQARKRLVQNPQAVLLDVREDHEWIESHAAGAQHLGRGVLERDLERRYPDPDREIIMYCGGGYRSVLTAAVAQQMGYRNIKSLAGGYKAMVEAKWPLERSTR